MRPHTGVDLIPSFLEKVTLKNFVVQVCWQRMMMGLYPCPYFTTKDMLVVDKIIRGDRKCVTNIFGWIKVVLNLPGGTSYDPTRSWVYKMREDVKITADFFTYIDDERPTAPTEWEDWQASKLIFSILCYLGLQDAARKRKSPGETLPRE